MNESSSSCHRELHNRDEMPPPPPVPGPLKSVEGWVLFVTGVHEESQEDDLRDLFGEYGKVKSIVLNLDRKTSLVKGYALVMFSERSEAQDALNKLHGALLLGKRIGVHWTFCKSLGNSLRGSHDLT
jgi:RNA-binding protein 8A